MKTWTKSRALLQRATQSLAGGVSSPFRASFPVPLYLVDGCGSRVEDEDGNSYIDYTLAWGPLILGHRHRRLVEAVAAQAQRPHIYGAQHENEYVVAEKVQRLVPCAERVVFTSSGSEAVQLALRLARAFTGRKLILKFEGHYHGWLDSVLISYHPATEQLGPREAPLVVLGSRGQIPNAAENTLVAVWNAAEAIEEIFRARGDEIAAVIMEPVLCNSGCLMPVPGYLETAREICRRHRALLIFDEVITGFRMALGGAQAYYGIRPDLVTLGKAIAGGLALSAVAGRKEIMELIAGGGVAFGGTFNGNPLSLAASRTTLEELERDDGAGLRHANRIGLILMDGFREAADRHGIALAVTGFGAAFAIHFAARKELIDYRDTLEDDREKLARFLLRMLEEGIYLLPDGRFYVSTAHSENDAAETVRAADRAFQHLR